MTVAEDSAKASESRHTNADGIEARIRAAGAVLDMPLTLSIYKPLLDRQPRDGVDVMKDLQYGADTQQRLDLYRSTNSRERHADILVFVHGGGFVRGDKSERENVGHYFARHGYLVVVPNYRLAPAHSWPSGAQDVVDVYRWVKQHAADYGYDAHRIFLCGESAGAAHVAAATLITRFHPTGGLQLAGTILISGVYNPHLEYLARSQFGIATPDPRNEAYFGSDCSKYRDMSTVELIDAAPMPLLITYAELDLLQMQVQAGELFGRLVTDHSFNAELKVIAGHSHLSQCYAVNTGDETLALTVLQFMRNT